MTAQFTVDRTRLLVIPFLVMTRVLGIGSTRHLKSSVEVFPIQCCGYQQSFISGADLLFRLFLFGCPSIRILQPYPQCSIPLTPTCLLPELMNLSFVKNPSKPVCAASAAKVPIYPHFLSSFDPSYSLADRRPIDPPPIVQLRVIDPALQSGNPIASSSNTRRDNVPESDSGSPAPRSFGDDGPDATTFSQSFLQNPYYFMFACLARPDDDAELHWLKVCFLLNPMTFITGANHSFRTAEQEVQPAQSFPLCIT